MNPTVENPALQKSLMDVPVQVDVVIGEARMSMDELLSLDSGDVVELTAATADLIDIYVSDRLLARGKLVVADGELGVTLTEIIDERTVS
jgi:flagellar motor switch protein FliN/FliY